jgi:hypothetical protein
VEAIQMAFKFKVAKACEKIFKLAENTWAIYSMGTINMNQVCLMRNMIQPFGFKSRDTISIDLGCYVRTMDHMISADESETV